MIRFRTFVEDVSQAQLNDLEKFADRILAKFGVDIEFTRHFADRMNDPRNKPAVKVQELQQLFKRIARNKAKNIRQNPDSEAVIKDMKTDINVPFVLNLNRGELELVAKTVMRKKNFKTPDRELAVEMAKRNTPAKAGKGFNKFLESCGTHKKPKKESTLSKVNGTLKKVNELKLKTKR